MLVFAVREVWWNDCFKWVEASVVELMLKMGREESGYTSGYTIAGYGLNISRA